MLGQALSSCCISRAFAQPSRSDCTRLPDRSTPQKTPMPPSHRKPIVAANWKMNNPPSETEKFLRSFLRLMQEKCPVQVVIVPPFVSLSKAQDLIHGGRTEVVELGAQNMSQHSTGAYTGEISAMMLKECCVRHVILGHSERRAMYGETN